MKAYMKSTIAAVPLAAFLLVGLGTLDGAAKTLPEQVGSDHTIKSVGFIQGLTVASDKNVAGIGEVFFPGDHFSRAFPGDHFTPRQRSMLEGQGIKSVADFIAADAAVISP